MAAKFVPLFARYHAVATNAVARLKMDVRVTADGGPEEGLVLNGASEPALAEAERVALAAVEKTVDANYFVGFALDPARDTAVMEAVREFQAHAQTAAPAAAAALPVSPFVSTDRLTLCVTPLKLYCAAHVQRARDVLAAAGAQQAPFQIGLQGVRALGPMKMITAPPKEDAAVLREFATRLHGMLQEAGVVPRAAKLMFHPHVSLIKITWDFASKTSKAEAQRVAAEMQLAKRGFPEYEGRSFGACTLDILKLLHIDAPTVRGQAHAVAGAVPLEGAA